MSDLFEVRQKVEEGANWRGTITVTIDGEQKDLTVRQLRDPEFWDVMSDIDTDELQKLQSDLPDEKMEEYRELQNADDLSEGEEDRLESLQREIEEEDVDLFDALSKETYDGIKQAAKYGVEPDPTDVQTALAQHTGEINDKYGGTSDEDARQYVNEHVIGPMIERSTNFTSFAIGVKALGETLGDEGNSES
jgi:hypothetical protein